MMCVIFFSGTPTSERAEWYQTNPIIYIGPTIDPGSNSLSKILAYREQNVCDFSLMTFSLFEYKVGCG
jgi:hypothetical protein